MAITAARGVVDQRLVEGQDPGLDAALLQFAVSSLSKAHMKIFYFAFHCQENWQAIHGLYQSQIDREIQIDSIERYGRDAIKRLCEQAPTSRALVAWQANYEKARNSP